MSTWAVLPHFIGGVALSRCVCVGGDSALWSLYYFLANTWHNLFNSSQFVRILLDILVKIWTVKLGDCLDRFPVVVPPGAAVLGLLFFISFKTPYFHLLAISWFLLGQAFQAVPKDPMVRFHKSRKQATEDMLRTKIILKNVFEHSKKMYLQYLQILDLSMKILILIYFLFASPVVTEMVSPKDF